jgi:mRNA interferase RelE/StbE
LAWLIKFDPRAVKELKKIDKNAQKRIIDYLKKKVATQDNPRIFGKSLKGDKRGFWRYRVGDYRIICDLFDDQMIILVIKIGHPQSIYD